VTSKPAHAGAVRNSKGAHQRVTTAGHQHAGALAVERVHPAASWWQGLCSQTVGRPQRHHALRQLRQTSGVSNLGGSGGQKGRLRCARAQRQTTAIQALPPTAPRHNHTSTAQRTRRERRCSGRCACMLASRYCSVWASFAAAFTPTSRHRTAAIGPRTQQHTVREESARLVLPYRRTVLLRSPLVDFERSVLTSFASSCAVLVALMHARQR